MTGFQKNASHVLTIEGYTAEGAGVARLEGRAVFVPGTIRGEVWRVLLVKVATSYAWGKGIERLGSSSARLTPDCPHSGVCGGCQFRHMSYEEELYAKSLRVKNALMRLGGVKEPLAPILGAQEVLRYRNKVQCPVAQGTGGPAVGFFRPRSHQVVDVEDCLLQPACANRLGRALKGWMEEYRVPAYDEEGHRGLIRHLYVRTGAGEKALCCLVVRTREIPQAEALVRALRAAAPELVGIVCNVNSRRTNVILGAEYHTLWGQDYLEEQLCSLRFRLSVPSFFQVNRDQTEVLYAKVLEYAALTGEETVLDLYCGIGTISLCLARGAKQVIGAEVVPQAVEDAAENARLNQVDNARFYCGDAGEIAARLGQEGLHPQVICVDPPRKGLGAEVPGILAAMAPERIVYVSCDPATLARDVGRFRDVGYDFVRGQPVDLFPRTAHIETVALLERIKNSAKISVTLNVGLDNTTEKD